MTAREDEEIQPEEKEIMYKEKREDTVESSRGYRKGEAEVDFPIYEEEERKSGPKTKKPDFEETDSEDEEPRFKIGRTRTQA